MSAGTSHLRLLAEVRWQVFRNGLRLWEKKFELAAQIALAILGAAVALVMGITFGVAAYVLLSRGQAALVTLMLWYLLALWQLGPVLMEASSPALNFREIARYPVSFRLYYLLNTAYGFLDPVALLCSCWLACIWLGLAMARPGWAARAALLFAVFALVNLFFNRVVFAFLERLLGTRRGRDRLFIALGALMLLSQVGIAMLPRVDKTRLRAAVRALGQAQRVTPPGLVSVGALGGGPGEVGMAAAGLGAYAAAAALLLRRQLWRKYRGEVGAEGQRAAHAVQVRAGWKLPWLDEGASAMVEKELRYTLRSPTMVINFLSPIVMATMGAVSAEVLQKAFQQGLKVRPTEVYPLVAYFSLLAMNPLAYNCFGYDAQGFQRWLMAPLELRRVFAAKNLAAGLLLAANFALVTLLLAVGLGLPAGEILRVAAGYLYAALATLGAGNLLSAWYPTGVEFGGMSGKRVSAAAALLGVFAQVVILGSLALVFYVAGKWNLDRLPLVAFGVLIVAAAKFYQFSLRAASERARTHSEEIAAALA